MGYRNYGPSSGLVVAKDNTGDFTTIATALTAASSGTTIFIKPGTYTENLTLKAGVNLTAWATDAYNFDDTGVSEGNSNVTIIGKATFTGAGTVVISGVQLQTNNDYFLSITGSSASTVNVVGCQLNCTNHTGIQYTSSSSSAYLELNNCEGDLGTTGIGMWTCSAPNLFRIVYCFFTNSGLSTTASTTSATNVQISWTILFFALSTSSTGYYTLFYTNHNCGAINTACLTTAGTGSPYLEYTAFISGTASALSIGVGTTVNCRYVRVSSSNTNAVTGSGAISIFLLFFENSTGNNVTSITYSPVPVQQGGTANTSTTAYAPIVGGTTSTGAFQSASTGLATSGLPLITNGNAAVPSFQALSASNVNGALPGSAPAAGVIGENILSTVTGVSISNLTPTSITSISLSQGVWMITGSMTANGSGQVITGFKIGVSNANNTFQGNQGDQFNTFLPNGVTATGSLTVPNYYKVLTVTQTWYVVCQANFGSGSVTVDARINALRVG